MTAAAHMSDDARRYYEGGKRVVIGGVPTRVAAHWRPPGSRAGELAIIKAAAEGGAAIESLEGPGPRFRFTPAPGRAPSDPYVNESPDWAERDNSPGPRGTYAPPRKPHTKGWKNWSPPRLSLDPMYATAMAGDPPELTRARELYSMGKPKLLRQWLRDERKRRERAELESRLAVTPDPLPRSRPLPGLVRRAARELKR